jgi:transposase
LDSAQTHIARSRSRTADKAFRVFDPARGLLSPASLDDWLPAEHLARFIAELVDEHLDLVRIRAAYTGRRGAPPCDPRLMVRILLYAYTIGVRSSRLIERKCVEDVAFWWLAAGTAPDYRAITRFRRRHLSALGHLLVQALALCQAASMVRLAPVALDGTRVRRSARSGTDPLGWPMVGRSTLISHRI